MITAVEIDAGTRFYVAASLQLHLLFNKVHVHVCLQVWCPVRRKPRLTRCAKNPLKLTVGSFFSVTSFLLSVPLNKLWCHWKLFSIC